MKNTGKQKKVKHRVAQEGLKRIDALFEELEKDNELPSFPEFFISCLMLDKGECVNLKKMFPGPYARTISHIKAINLDGSFRR